MAICWIHKIVNANLTGSLTFQCYELNRRARDRATNRELGPDDQIVLAAGQAAVFDNLAIPWGGNDQRLIVTSDLGGERRTLVYDILGAEAWDWVRIRDVNGTEILRIEVGSLGDVPGTNHSGWELRLEPDGSLNMLREWRQGLTHGDALKVGEIFLGVGIMAAGIAIVAGGAVIGGVFGVPEFVDESVTFGSEVMAVAIEAWIDLGERWTAEKASVQPARAVSAARLNVACAFSPARGYTELLSGSAGGSLHFVYSQGGNWAVDTGSLAGFGLLAGPMSAVYSESAHHTEAYYRGEDGYLRFLHVGAGWTLEHEEFKQAGKISGDLSAVYSPSRRHSEVYFRPDDGNLHLFYKKEGRWVHDGLAFQQGGKVLGAISAVYAPHREHTEVFYHGLDGYLHYFYVNEGGWAHDGESFKQGGQVGGDVAAVYSSARNHSEVFYASEDGYLRYFFVSASGWTHDSETFRVAGRVAGTIAAVYSPIRNHSEVFFRGEDGFVHYFFLNGDRWGHTVFSSAPKVAGPITAVYSPVHQHSEVYYRGEDGSLNYHYVADGRWQHTHSFEGEVP